MTFRHAAALALVGWYLMLPPIYDVPTATRPESVKIGDKFAEVRPTAPLGVWEVSASFDSADACQAALYQMSDRMMKLWAKEAKEGKNNAYSELQAYRYGDAHCIATDDPRLKAQ